MTNILQRYEALADEKRWDEALPVIRAIIDANPAIDTSWFNCGVCLDELGRHAEAAEAFIKAQELNIQDWGIHYRILRSFFLADDIDQFFEFADYSCGLSFEMIAVLIDTPDFSSLHDRPEFDALKEKYAQH